MEERGMVSNNGTPYGMGGVSIRRGLSFQSRRERVGGGGSCLGIERITKSYCKTISQL